MKQFQGGHCLVANRVIDQIIAMGAADVDGVQEVIGWKGEGSHLRHDYEQSIHTETKNGILTTSLVLRVRPGYSIVEVVEAVQKSVKSNVEAVLGLQCRQVDVLVI